MHNQTLSARGRLWIWGTLAAALAVAGCSRGGGAGGSASDATPTVLQANATMAKGLNLADPQDFEDAKRGFIAKPSGQIKSADGSVLKDFDVYAFLDGSPADTVNPSLWRHAQLNARAGLFKVSEGLYQLRGFDLANMTLIEGRSGWIVVDPLTARESAAAAIENWPVVPEAVAAMTALMSATPAEAVSTRL